MTNKNKTISFRIREDNFNELQSIADDQDLSLSAVFREYVESIISHEGQVEVVPQHGIRDEATNVSDSFPHTVEVPKGFVREHERLELECEHLREQLNEYKRYTSRLESQLKSHEEYEEEVVRLEELDFEAGTSLMIE